MKSLKNFLGLENGQTVDNLHLKSNNRMAPKYGAHSTSIKEENLMKLGGLTIIY